jgi:plasmid stabilization system protein ParE
VSRVIWDPDALKDVSRLYDFLIDKNSEAAIRAVKTIRQAAKSLEQMPELGRPMHDNSGRREILVSFSSGAYVLRYVYAKDDTVTIVRIWHSREVRH